MSRNKSNKCWKGYGENGILLYCWWNINWYNYYEEQYGSSLKTKNRCTIWPSNPTAGHIPGENHGAKWYVHPNVTAALLPTANIWKQPKCPSIDEWIKKMCSVWLYQPHFTPVKKLSQRGEWLGQSLDNLCVRTGPSWTSGLLPRLFVTLGFQPKVIFPLSSPTLDNSPIPMPASKGWWILFALPVCVWTHCSHPTFGQGTFLSLTSSTWWKHSWGSWTSLNGLLLVSDVKALEFSKEKH